MRQIAALCFLLSSGGCGSTNCAALDVDCFLSHLEVESGGRGVATVQLPETAIGRSLQPGVTQSALPDLAAGAFTALGCFKDDAGARDLDGASSWSSSLTVESCAASCAGWAYFAVQDQNWCYCGNQSGRYGAATDAECDLACPGAPGENCGGYLRSRVYAFAGAAAPDAGTPRDGGGGTTVFAPTISVSLTSVVLPVGKATPLGVTFQDDNGCTPSFCFSFCSPGLRCTTSRACTHTLRDGLVSGVWRGSLNPLYGPPDGTPAMLELHVDAFGTPDCADFPSLVQELERSGFASGGERPAAGGSVVVQATVERPSGSSGGGNLGGNATCGSATDPCPGSSSCTYQACVAVDTLGGCQDGYRTSDGQEFDCASCGDCTAAASAITQHCCPPSQ